MLNLFYYLIIAYGHAFIILAYILAKCKCFFVFPVEKLKVHNLDFNIREFLHTYEKKDGTFLAKSKNDGQSCQNIRILTAFYPPCRIFCLNFEIFAHLTFIFVYFQVCNSIIKSIDFEKKICYNECCAIGYIF